jgi:hypothetical protein
LEGKPNKLNNASDAEPNHVEKIGPHSWNMGCHRGPHPYPQGTMKHQKGHEPFEKPNQNKNSREAQKLKKEGPL